MSNYQANVKKQKATDLDMEVIYKESMAALINSDVIIIEATSYSFFQGFQLAVALEAKKPTLILTRHPARERIMSGIKNEFLELKEYKKENELDSIVGKFIDNNTLLAEDLRLEFSVDTQLYAYLRAKSTISGKSKGQILYELARREFEQETSG